MELWELFLRGLGKSVEEFIVRMIEKGKTVAEETESVVSKPASKTEKPVTEEAIPAGVPGKTTEAKSRAEESGIGKASVSVKSSGSIDQEMMFSPSKDTPDRRSYPKQDISGIRKKVLKVVSDSPNGCTLKDIARELDMQWHFLRIPLRQMVIEGDIVKDGKVYSAVKSEPQATPETEVKEVPAEPEKAPEIPRRRVVDARLFSEQVQQKAPESSSEMTPREKEILRFKILTAFRGRPEGLKITELAAVLGRSVDGLDGIIAELVAEKKVVEGRGDKFHLA